MRMSLEDIFLSLTTEESTAGAETARPSDQEAVDA
jgi:hypothetical protein